MDSYLFPEQDIIVAKHAECFAYTVYIVLDQKSELNLPTTLDQNTIWQCY